MREYVVRIEREGRFERVGTIAEGKSGETVFRYAKDYLDRPDAVPISLSLPLRDRPFSGEETRTFFEGLLPEGFTRRAVAGWMRVDERDYLSILYGLGRECLGAVRISPEEEPEEAWYEKVSPQQMKDLAAEGAVKSAELVVRAHLSLTGASGKVGLYHDEAKDEWYLPHGTAPSTHIVKQSHIRFGEIVTNEQLALLTAKQCGIDIPESFILNVGNGSDAEVLFATRRFDRQMPEEPILLDGLPRPLRLHQEDFAQALGIPAERKYEQGNEGYLKRMFDLLFASAENPLRDRARLWRRVVFYALIGNADAHIKNISLLYAPDLKSLSLAPAYDIVSTAVYEQSSREMAFAIGGDRMMDAITRKSFRRAAEEIGLPEKAAMRTLEEVCGTFEGALAEAARVLTEQGFEGAEELREKMLRGGVFRHL